MAIADTAVSSQHRLGRSSYLGAVLPSVPPNHPSDKTSLGNVRRGRSSKESTLLCAGVRQVRLSSEGVPGCACVRDDAVSEARWIDSVSLEMGVRFTGNIRDCACWEDDGTAGVYGNFDQGERFATFGFNLGVVLPGQPVALEGERGGR